jgi:uncharacterized protein (TIGR02099 family)
MSMKHKGLKQGLNIINVLLVATFIVLALYSAVGQQVIPYIGKYRLDVERYVTQQLNSLVEIRHLSGDMKVLTPSVHIEGITMYSSLSSNNSKPVLSIAAVDAVLDPGLSLLNLTPVFKSVRLSGVSILVDKEAFSSQPANSDQDQVSSVQAFVETLLLQQHLEVNNVSIETWLDDKPQTLQLDHLVMSGDGFNRLMTGSISYGGENKIKAGLRIFSQGNPYDLTEFYTRGVIDLPALDVNYWLEQFFGTAVFNEFDASAQLGFEFKNSLLNYAKLTMATPNLSISEEPEFKNINTQLWLKQGSIDTWSLWLENSQFTYKDKKWPLENMGLKLSKTHEGNRWHGYAKTLDLQYLQAFLTELDQVPDSLEPLLSGLKAQGELNNLSVIVQQTKDEDLDFTVVAELEGVSVDAHDGIPGIKNVNGVLAATKNSGRVQFSSKDMELNFHGVYEHPLEVVSGRGQVEWYLDEKQTRIVGDGFNLSLPDVASVKGGFQLWLPTSSELDPALELNLSFSEAQVSVHKTLVPQGVGKDLISWLDSALEEGVVNNGNVYLYSDLSKDNPLAQVEVYLDVEDVNLSYLSQWPEIHGAKGKLFISNSDVYAKIDTAKTLGGVLQGTEVAFKIDEREREFLWINGTAKGLATDLFSYFHQTPLQTIIDSQFDDWRLTGSHETQLSFKIPLNTPIEDMGIGINSRLSDAELHLNDVGLNFLALDGSIQFSSEQGLSSPGLSAELWEQELTAGISGEINNGNMVTDISFDGVLNTQGMKNWLKLGFLNDLSGRAPVTGNFIIDADEKGFTGLKLKSNLQGVQLNLPAILGKTKDQKVEFNTSVQIKDSLILKLAYDEKVNLAMEFKGDEFFAGQVYLGKTEAYVPSSPGLVVQGHMESINVNEWLKVWEGIEGLDKHYNSTGTAGSNPLRRITLSSDEITYNDFNVKYVKSNINVSGKKWEIDVDSPLVTGSVVYEKGKPINADLKYLHWPMMFDEQEKSDLDPLKDIDPTGFPALNLKVAEVFVGPTNYGRWQFKVNPNDQGVVVSDINGEIKKLNVTGDIGWVKNPQDVAQQKTSVNLQLSSSDVGGIQKAWHEKPTVEADYLNAKLSMNWLASPAQFEVETLLGTIDLQLKDGRFIEVKDTGALSAFGLLNFGAIGRRLRLDFSDVYERGVHFDDIKGKAKITNGLIEIIDTLDFVGPSANFSASGTINTLTKELDQELAVTFPVFSTLPFVAILAGFAPPIAASIFVGEKLVGGEIEKFSSATYKLQGSWEEPKLTLMKRFDNDIEGKTDKSFWLRMKDVFGLGGAD